MIKLKCHQDRRQDVRGDRTMPFLQDESLSSRGDQASTSSAMAVVQGTIYKEKKE